MTACGTTTNTAWRHDGVPVPVQMTTPLYPAMRKRVDDAVHLLVQNQVTPWSFLTAGPPFRSKYFDGKPINYQGIGFEGSPHTVFWGRYIEPFLENLCVTEIAFSVATAKERDVDGRATLSELANLLKAACRRVYEAMAETDQRLRGRGFPNSVNRRPIENEYAGMVQFIDSHVGAEVAMWKSKSRLETWAAGNNFWKFVIPIVVSVLLWILSKVL